MRRVLVTWPVYGTAGTQIGTQLRSELIRLNYLPGAKVADPEQAWWTGRVLLLRAVYEEFPDVMHGLHGLVPVWDRSGIADYLSMGLGRDAVVRHALEPCGKFAAVRHALDEWAERWNLHHDWIYEAALDTLEAWHAGGADVGEVTGWVVRFRGRSTVLTRELVLALSDPKLPNPLSETLEGAERRLMPLGVPQSRVRVEYARLVAVFKDAGFSAAPVLKNTTDSTERPFFQRWRFAARRLVERASYEMIGSEQEVDGWNVRRDVQAVARLANITIP